MRWPHLFYPACHCAPPQCQVAKIRIDIHVYIHQPSDSATCIHIHVTHTSRYTRRHPYARKDVTISYRTGLDRIQGPYPHARGGRDRRPRRGLAPRAGFYPRARGGRDVVLFQVSLVLNVSIHAPAGGATPWWLSEAVARVVSIHAPAGGATPEKVTSLVYKAWFLSTRPRGARHDIDTNEAEYQFVSIHAPPGGATMRLES